MKRTRRLWMALLITGALALPAASAQEEGFTIAGTITNWPGGEAEVRAEQYNPMSPALREEVATGTIVDDGSFEVTLPPITIGLMRSQLERVLGGCEDVTITPEGTWVGLGHLVVYRNGEPIADLAWEQVEELVWFPPVGSEFITLAYFNNDATIQGHCEEVSNPFFQNTTTTILDIEVAQGWNPVVWTVTETRWPEEFHMTAVASVGGGEDIPWVVGFRGRIGVNLPPNEENSAVVTEVAPGSPAEQAGFLPGDVIVEVDGQDVRGKNPLFLIRGEPGTTVTVGVMREGEPEPIQLEATRGRQ